MYIDEEVFIDNETGIQYWVIVKAVELVICDVF